MNRAGDSTVTKVGPIFVDKSEPISGLVVDGDDFMMDLTDVYSRSQVTGKYRIVFTDIIIVIERFIIIRRRRNTCIAQISTASTLNALYNTPPKKLTRTSNKLTKQ